MKKLLLALCLALASSPAYAGPYDQVLSDAQSLNTQISAFSLVNTTDVNAINKAKGDLSAMEPFAAALAANLAGVDLGPASEIQSISADLNVKIKTAKGETNLFKLAVDIVNDIGPLIDRGRALLPSLITELEKANIDPLQQVKDAVAAIPTATPAPARPPSPYAKPTTIVTPIRLRPTPVDPQFNTPGIAGPAVSAPPPPPGNPGLIPPSRVFRPTATPQPYTPPVAAPQPTAQPTAVGVLKAPAAMLLPNHQRWLYVAQVNVGQLALVDTRLRRVTKTLAVGKRPVALAMDDSSQVLVVANYDSHSVTLVDDRVQAVLGSVAVGRNPVDVVVTPGGKKAYVLNQGSGNVSVVLLENRVVLKTIRVGAGPSQLELDQGGRHVYVSNTQSDTVAIIDTAVDEVVAEVAQ